MRSAHTQWVRVNGGAAQKESGAALEEDLLKSNWGKRSWRRWGGTPFSFQRAVQAPPTKTTRATCEKHP